jgi:hypothetical protein
MLIPRKPFFTLVRHTVFGGKLTKEQVDGLEKILGFWEAYTAVQPRDARHLGYMLATTFWETGRTMQPVREFGAPAYLRSKPYWPWIGRGLVQLTWKQNYVTMNAILQKAGAEVDLLSNPDDAMKWEYALPIMFEGMTLGWTSKGDFTGKALEHYFNDTKDDPIGARAIINGTDRAETIAGVHQEFCAAILKAVSDGSSTGS